MVLWKLLTRLLKYKKEENLNFYNVLVSSVKSAQKDLGHLDLLLQ